MDQNPDAIRREIAETRASIDTRLSLLQHRARELHPRNYAGLIALGSVVAAGTVALGGAVRSQRRASRRRAAELREVEARKVEARLDYEASRAEARHELEANTAAAALAHEPLVTANDDEEDDYEIVFEPSPGPSRAAWLLSAAAAGALASTAVTWAMQRRTRREVPAPIPVVR